MALDSREAVTTMPTMQNVLTREAASGFPGLAGARLRATIPISEVLLNEALRRVPGVPAGVVLDLQPDNRVVVRYGLVHARATLAPEVRVGDGPPQVVVELASTVIAWTLTQALRTRVARIEGRRLTIDLGGVAALDGFRDHWRHLERVRLQTTAGYLHVDVAAAVR